MDCIEKANGVHNCACDGSYVHCGFGVLGSV